MPLGSRQRSWFLERNKSSVEGFYEADGSAAAFSSRHNGGHASRAEIVNFSTNAKLPPPNDGHESWARYEDLVEGCFGKGLG